ncbi:hypothetical protein D3C81_745180 [compost metagenome]
MSCSAPIQSINRPKPTVSILKEIVSVSAGLSKRIAAKTQIMPTGMLIKKIQCQDRLSLIRPPKIGPKIGPTTVVIAQRPIACACFSLGKIRMSKVWLSGISGPPHRPCPIRKNTSMPNEFARPHKKEKIVKPIRPKIKTRTVPKRPASQPVKGTQIASATAYEVTTHVPCVLETARLPVMCGTDTLAIVVSSTTIKFDKAITNAASNKRPPLSSAKGVCVFISVYFADKSTFASIDKPTRSGCSASSFGSSAIRTGKR